MKSVPENLCVGHNLAYIYLYTAKYNDCTITTEELQETYQMIKYWMGDDTSYEDLKLILIETDEWFKSGSNMERTIMLEKIINMLYNSEQFPNKFFPDIFEDCIRVTAINNPSLAKKIPKSPSNINLSPKELLDLFEEYPVLLKMQKFLRLHTTEEPSTGKTPINDDIQKLTDIQISNICSKIESEKLLPFLPYIYKDLSSLGFDTDKHNPFYFNSSVKIGDDMHGFLYVNMDGFFSNCVNDDEVTQVFNWDSVMDLKIKINSDDMSAMIALCTEDGMLTIEDVNGTSLKIVKAIYDTIWQDVIQEFKDAPMILWNKIDDMGVKRKSFDSSNIFIEYFEENKTKLSVEEGSRQAITEDVETKPKDANPETKEVTKHSKISNKSMLPFAELFKAEKSIEALDSIFEKSHSLWIENLNKISKVNYIMFCEAPPFDESGSVSNYIYDRNGEAKGMYLKAPYKALKGEVETYPPKAEMIDFLNEKGFLFLDVLPLSISFSPKRNTKQYRDFVKYFWNGNGANLDFSEFIVQNRLNEMKYKISDDLRVCFALKSISLVVNSLDNPDLIFADKTIHIHEDLVGLNTAGQPGVTEITNAFKFSVLK